MKTGSKSSSYYYETHMKVFYEITNTYDFLPIFNLEQQFWGDGISCWALCRRQGSLKSRG